MVLPAAVPSLAKGHLMVVRHHHGHSQFHRAGHRLRGGDPVVAGQKQPYPVRIRLGDNAQVQAVALRHPVRRVNLCLSSQPPNPLIEDQGRKDSVHIEVRGDPYKAPRPDAGQNLVRRQGRIL